MDPGDRQESEGKAQPENAETENDETFLERVQYMFRSTPPPALGFADQTTDGGPPTTPCPTRSRDPTTQHSVPKASERQEKHAPTARPLGSPSGAPQDQDGSPIHACAWTGRASTHSTCWTDRDSPSCSSRSSCPRPTSSRGCIPVEHQSTSGPCAHGAADDQGMDQNLTATRRRFLVPPRRHRYVPLRSSLRRTKTESSERRRTLDAGPDRAPGATRQDPHGRSSQSGTHEMARVASSRNNYARAIWRCGRP